MKWNASANLCISVLQIKSQASVCRKMLTVVLFQRWTVQSCEFKRVGDWLFPKQSSSWLRHSNPCAPNHTAVLSKETHQRWVSRAGLPHTQSLQYGPCTHTNIFIESLTNCSWILNSMTHNERAIRPLYRWRGTKHSNAAFSIGKLTTCWFLWPDCRTAGMISGLPAHLNVSTFPPSFLSSISTAHLHHNLSAPISGVAMCDTGWDIFRRLGLSPEPTCLSLLNGAMCACVCLLAQLDDILMFACHPLVIILFWEFKHVLLQQLPHLSLPQFVFIERVRFVPNLVGIKLRASLTCAYILMKPWSHLFASWFTLQSS